MEIPILIAPFIQDGILTWPVYIVYHDDPVTILDVVEEDGGILIANREAICVASDHFIFFTSFYYFLLLSKLI
jgi:hypothetical protein